MKRIGIDRAVTWKEAETGFRLRRTIVPVSTFDAMLDEAAAKDWNAKGVNRHRVFDTFMPENAPIAVSMMGHTQGDRFVVQVRDLKKSITIIAVE